MSRPDSASERSEAEPGPATAGEPVSASHEPDGRPTWNGRHWSFCLADTERRRCCEVSDSWTCAEWTE